MDKIDYSKIPQDLQDKIKGWEGNSPANQQLQTLKDIGQIVEGLTIELAKSQDKSEESVSKFGALLTDIRESLSSLNDKEAPDTPDYAKPIVSAVKGLETALTASLKAIDVKPVVNPQISVEAPNVTVSPAKVDLRGVEKALSAMPQAFEKAIGLIPEAPSTDLSPVLDQLKTMTDWLKSIDTASRLKANGPGTSSSGGGGGDASAANQVIGNASLLSIDTKTPPLGQALAAGSTPVVLTAAQVTTLTPPTNALTDTQLRATPVPVSGTVTTGGLTDTQLRATPVPVSGTVGVTGVATAANQSSELTLIGAVTETAPASDTASSGLNGRLQRIAQRITSLITALGSPFQAGGSIGNTAFGVNNASGASAVNIQDGGNSITVDGTITANPTIASTLVAFATTVTTAGTRVQLASNSIKAGILQAPSTNTGLIYVGTVTVSGTVFGSELQPGQSTGIEIDNTNKIYIDSSVNGNKCSFLGSV